MPENPILSMPNGERYDRYEVVDYRQAMSDELYATADMNVAEHGGPTATLNQYPILRRLPQDESPLGDELVAPEVESSCDCWTPIDLKIDGVWHRIVAHRQPQEGESYLLEQNCVGIAVARPGYPPNDRFIVKPFDPPKPERFRWQPNEGMTGGVVTDSEDPEWRMYLEEQPGKALARKCNSLVANQEEDSNANGS